MKKKNILLSVAGCAAFCVVVASLYFFILFDPFEWGVVHSSEFTWDRFASVKPGERIETVIDLLGEPVRKPQKISVMTSDPADPCVTGECREYIFAGAKWGASYREAIVITDRSGRVISAQSRQE